MSENSRNITNSANSAAPESAGHWQDQIDLLVERELGPSDRQAVINQMECQPELWKTCALAFIERDNLQSSLRAIVHSGEAVTSRPRKLQLVAERADWLSGAHSSTQLEQGRAPANSAAITKNKRAIAGQRLSRVATAAAVLLLTGLGYIAGNVFQWPAVSPASHEHTTVADHADEQPMRLDVGPEQVNREMWLQVSNAISRLSVADSRVIALVDIRRDDSHSEILPIIQSPTLARQVQLLPRPSVSRDWVEKVNRAGWQFDSSRQFLSLHLPNGQNQVLPVDTLNYRFVGNDIF